MKIAIIGYSGSGKSTTAAILSEKLNIPALHLDTIHFLPGWVERSREDELALLEKFMSGHDSWIIDGNYSGLHYEKRMTEADKIIFFDFPRLVCLVRAFRRYLKNRGCTRSSMAEGCQEKFDLEFILWILCKGRSRSIRSRYENVMAQYPDKIIRLRSQSQLDAFLVKFSLFSPEAMLY